MRRAVLSLAVAGAVGFWLAPAAAATPGSPTATVAPDVTASVGLRGRLICRQRCGADGCRQICIRRPYYDPRSYGYYGQQGTPRYGYYGQYGAPRQQAEPSRWREPATRARSYPSYLDEIE